MTMQNNDDGRPPLEVTQTQQQVLPPSITTPTMAATTSPAMTAVPEPPQTIKNIAESDRSSVMDLDNNTGATNTSGDRTRATSVLSIDDIEAAQALEGLRSGKLDVRDKEVEAVGANVVLSCRFRSIFIVA